MKYPVEKIPPDRNSENAKAQNSEENSWKNRSRVHTHSVFCQAGNNRGCGLAAVKCCGKNSERCN